MNNVPSSALLAIVAVICAVMTGMIVFLVVNSGVLSGNNANKTALGLTGKAAEEIYTDYDGQQVTGRQVLAAIEKMKGQSVSVAVVDGSGVMTQFFYDYHGEGSSEPLTSLEDQYSSMIKQAKTKGSASYIPPSAFYFGHVITDSKSGAIYQIRFEVQVSDSATGSSDSSSAYEGNHQDLGHYYVVTLKSGYNDIQDIKYSVPAGSTITPATLSRSDKRFVGWFTSKNGGTKLGAKVKVTKNAVYYAHWDDVESGTIIYEANGGSGSMAQQTVRLDRSCTIASNAFTRTGYVFSGWNTAADGSGTTYTQNSVESNLMTQDKQILHLYAQWTPISYTIAFHANGGTGHMVNQTIQYGNLERISSNAFTLEGSVFVGWSTTANGNVVYTDGQKVKNLSETDGDVVNLYAKYKLSYTSFDTGATVNKKIISLAGNAGNITAFTRAAALKSGFTATTANTISVDGSRFDIYAWYESGVVYWYTQDTGAYFNKDSSGMFKNLQSMKTAEVGKINTTYAKDMSEMFLNDASLEEIDMSGWSDSSATKTNIFKGCVKISKAITGPKSTAQRYLPTPNSQYIPSASGKWYGSTGAVFTSDTLPLNTADTYYADNAQLPAVLAPKDTWFKGNQYNIQKTAIKTINFVNTYTESGLENAIWNADVENAGTIKAFVTGDTMTICNVKGDNGIRDITLSSDASGMFSGFTNVETIKGLQLLNTVNVEKGDKMFGGTSSTEQLKNLKRMSGYASWNTVSIHSVKNMFSGIALTSLDLSGWNLSNLVTMDSMFESAGCKEIKLNGVSLENVRSVANTFANCTNLEVLNLSGTGLNPSTANAFAGDTKLMTIYVSADGNWTKASSDASIFSDTTSLVGGYGTECDGTLPSAQYARIDKQGTPGYFSEYVIGSRDISGVLYDSGSVSNSYVTLTENGTDATPWNYKDGARLLEITVSNLPVGEEKTLTITVPVGMQFMKNTWTTASSSAVKSVKFEKNTNQGTGSVVNNMTGKLIYTIDASASAAKINVDVMFDTRLWNKRADKDISLVTEPAVTAEIDQVKSIRINNVYSSYACDNRSTGYGISTYGTLSKLAIGYPNGQKTNQYTNDIYLRECSGSNFFKSLVCTYTLYSTNKNGDKIYGEYVGNSSGTTFGNPVTKDGVTTLTWTNTTNNNFGSPIYKLDPAEGFIKGRAIYQIMTVKATFFNGSTQTWSTWNTMTLNSTTLDYKDLEINASSMTTVLESWHGNYTGLYDRLGTLAITYRGYADATDITALYTFDTSTASGTAPSMKVVSTRFSLPANQKTDVAVTLINKDGVTSGPYTVKNVASSGDPYGGYISANKVAKDNGLSGTYYLKSLRYKISTLHNSGNGLYLWGYGQVENPNFAGTFIGYVTKKSTSTLQLYKPNGDLIRTATCTTNVKTSNISNSAWIPSVNFNGSSTVTAGANLTWDVRLFSTTRPYGNTSHIKKPVLYLRLPQGISITSAVYSKTSGGSKVADANISVIKQESVNGVVYRYWKIIPTTDLNYGGYSSWDTGQGSSDHSRYLRIKMTTDPDMEQTNIVIKENIGLLLDGHSSNELREWEKNYLADKYDMDNDGNTTENVGTIQDQTLTFKILPKED